MSSTHRLLPVLPSCRYTPTPLAMAPRAVTTPSPHRHKSTPYIPNKRPNAWNRSPPHETLPRIFPRRVSPVQPSQASAGSGPVLLSGLFLYKRQQPGSCSPHSACPYHGTMMRFPSRISREHGTNLLCFSLFPKQILSRPSLKGYSSRSSQYSAVVRNLPM